MGSAINPANKTDAFGNARKSQATERAKV